MYPHNISLSPDQVLFVDRPHAKHSAPSIDLLMVLQQDATAIDPILRK